MKHVGKQTADRDIVTQDQLSGKADRNGGNTFSGRQKFNDDIQLSKPAGVSSEVQFRRAGIARWVVAMNDEAESVPNGGSNFGIYRFSDDGEYVDAPMQVSRYDGIARFATGVLAPQVFVEGPTESYLALRFGSPGIPGWDIQRLPDSVGGDLLFSRYGTDGVYVDSPLQFRRTGGIMHNTPVRYAAYNLATLPSAAAYFDFYIEVFDATGGPKLCRSDGTNWKIANTTITVS